MSSQRADPVVRGRLRLCVTATGGTAVQNGARPRILRMTTEAEAVDQGAVLKLQIEPVAVFAAIVDDTIFQ
jgi:hypothetical protein